MVQGEWTQFGRLCAITTLRPEPIFKHKTGTTESVSLRRIACEIALVILILSVVTPTITSARSLQAAGMQLSAFAAGGASGYTSVGECVMNSTALPTILRCSLNPSDDAFVDDLAPTKSYGDLPVLIVQDTPSIPKSRNYAYLKFDLPDTLPTEILVSHSRPVNATLGLYVRLTVASNNASIGVYYVPSNDWDERTLTWDNRPLQDASGYAARDVTLNGTRFSWNVTTATGLAMGQGESVSLAVIPTSNAARNYVWFDSKEHAINKLSTWPTLNLVFVEPYLNLVTQFPHLPLTIDNQTYETDSDGRLGAYLPWGSYRLTIPETIPKGDGVRQRFVGWSDNVTEATRMIALGNNLTLSANYMTQYQLDVSSPFASTGGSGWYFENTLANASINPTPVPAEGFLGLLGIRHVFDHWTGDCQGSQSVCSVSMNGPKNVLAVWRDDYTITVIAVISLVAIAAIVVMRKRKRKRTTREAPRRRRRRRSSLRTVGLVLW